MNNTAHKEYEKFINNGEHYRTAALKGYENGKFGLELAYSTILMSLENYLVGVLEYKGVIPSNHTFTDLTEELVANNLIDQELATELNAIDLHFNLCSLDPLTKIELSNELVEGLLKLSGKVKVLAEKIIAA